MIFIVGTKFHVSGSERTREAHRCSQCGFNGQFIEKSGRNYITLFFVLPLIPLGKAQNLIECPNCKMRYSKNSF